MIRFVSLCLFALSVFAAPLPAQEPESPDAPATPAPDTPPAEPPPEQKNPPVEVKKPVLEARPIAERKPASIAEKKTGHRVLSLTLPQAIRFALGKNFSLEAERFSPRIAKEQLRTATGRFDPVLDVTYRHGEDTVRNRLFDDPLTGTSTRVRVGTTAQDDVLSLGVSGVTPWGLAYDFGASARRNQGAGRLGSEYSNELSFGVNQPLLRGAGRDVNLAGIRTARNNVAISEWGLRDQAMSVITDVIITYNELHFAQENLEVARRSRALAAQLMQDNIKKLEIGTMTKLQVSIARAQVAARENAILQAYRSMKDRENFLKQLITSDLISLLGTDVEIAPPPTPAYFEALMSGIKEALVLRPDYQQAKLDIANRRISMIVQKNALLPRLDLNASLSLLGLDNDFGGSLTRSAANRDQTGWTVGATFSFPLGNREARGRYNAATLDAAQALVRLHQLEQNIIVQIDNANGAVITARDRISANAEARLLAKETLSDGEGRLQVGARDITVFEVLELQNNLAEAEVAELRARVDYSNAVARYQLETGTTLQVRKVKVE